MYPHFKYQNKQTLGFPTSEHSHFVCVYVSVDILCLLMRVCHTQHRGNAGAADINECFGTYERGNNADSDLDDSSSCFSH
mmetsp:Transcript_72930/g.106977  ORF Transcript_72930/g.106977 Transcript_72930/m.106977 type:complete len:80 (-) Transcript_72930:98-337(-)